MSAKNATTTRKSATKQPTRAELRKKLARDIASILTNPECPVELYNDIGENVCNWSTDYCNALSQTPQYIEDCLTSHLHAEEKRKGGQS